MRKNIIKKYFFIAVFTGIIGIGTTTAYFTAYDRETNRVAAGRNVTEIIEDFPGPTPTPSGDNLEFKKVVTITNNSDEQWANVDCYVRAMVSYSNYDIGKAVSLIGMDSDYWTYNSSDGYYYYKNVLEKGQTTKPLFTGFRVDQSKVDKQYIDQIGDFQINIYEESVQKGEFKDYASAWNYYLNPITDF